MTASIPFSPHVTVPTRAAPPANEQWPTSLLALIVLAGCLMFVTWTAETRRVRLANSDDQVLHGRVWAHQIGAHFREEAGNQGRFYFASPSYVVPWAILRIRSNWVFSAVRVAAFFLGAALLAGLVARHTGSSALGLMTGFGVIGALHLPATFYPVLSYPPMALGFAAIAAGLLFQLSYARTGNAAAGLSSGLGALAGFFCSELFVVFAPLFLAAARSTSRSGREAVRRSMPALVAAVAYVCVYAQFAYEFRSQYNGTRFAAEPTESISTLLRQTVSALPGFELVVNRQPPGLQSGAPWRTSREIVADLTALSPMAVALAFLQAGLLFALARMALNRPPVSRTSLVVLAACVLLPNLPISLTERYQILSHHRLYPYVYSYFSYCAFIALAVLGWHRCASPLTGRWRSVALGTFASGSMLIFVSAAAATQRTLGLLHQWYNP